MNGPIIMGISGLAGTGKTSVAEAIVPKARFIERSDFIWDHIFFALPLYELASIKTNVRGLREKDRQLYEIHDVLYDLFGGSPIADVPDYNELTKLVHDIYNLPIEQDVKPRSFLQKAGDLCRDVRPDCFAKWAVNKSKKLYHTNKLHQNYLNEASGDDPDTEMPFIVIVSDVRFKNEAEHILDADNGVLINFSASDEVRFQRLMDRDGYMMSEEQRKHKSENEMDAVKEMAHIIIDTDNLTIEEQANATIHFMKEHVMNYA